MYIRKCKIIKKLDFSISREDFYIKTVKLGDYFKELWKKFIEFLKDKFFSSNKYDDFINNLYDEDILDENDIGIIQNNTKDKDDFER